MASVVRYIVARINKSHFNDRIHVRYYRTKPPVQSSMGKAFEDKLVTDLNMKDLTSIVKLLKTSLAVSISPQQYEEMIKICSEKSAPRHAEKIVVRAIAERKLTITAFQIYLELLRKYDIIWRVLKDYHRLPRTHKGNTKILVAFTDWAVTYASGAPLKQANLLKKFILAKIRFLRAKTRQTRIPRTLSPSKYVPVALFKLKKPSTIHEITQFLISNIPDFKNQNYQLIFSRNIRYIRMHFSRYPKSNGQYRYFFPVPEPNHSRVSYKPKLQRQFRELQINLWKCKLHDFTQRFLNAK